MILLAALLLAIAIFIGLRAIAAAPAGGARLRLDEIAADGTPAATEEPRGLAGRVVRPLAQGLAGALSALLPDHLGDWLQGEIEAAGFNFGPDRIVVAAVASTLFFTAPAALAVDDLATLGTGMRWGLVALAAAVGAAAPVIWVQGRAARRQHAIQRSLPDTLDLIVVSVEAGLGFEAAVARITDQQEGPLALELRRMLADVNLGISRREAMQAMARRARTPAVSSLVAAVLQSERTGMGVGAVLRSQSAHVRTLRRQHAEETAMKAPLKMLFPLIFFIFPSLFVVVLGPAILNLMSSLGGS